jgi:hypothetical protein
LIQALSVGGSSDGRRLVYGRIDPQRELAGKLFARLDAVFSASLEKNLQRNPPSLCSPLTSLT